MRSRERKEALRDAVLEPPLFKELYNTKLEASDDSILYHLVSVKNFSHDGASRLIDVFRSSLRLAESIDFDTMSQGEEDEITPDNSQSYDAEKSLLGEQAAPKPERTMAVQAKHPDQERGMVMQNEFPVCSFFNPLEPENIIMVTVRGKLDNVLLSALEKHIGYLKSVLNPGKSAASQERHDGNVSDVSPQ